MTIEIDTEVLGQDITTMEDKLSALQTAVSNMYAAVEELNGMWQGTAHDVFEAETMVDREKFSALFNELHNLVSCMSYARREYTVCENDVNSLIASISV